MLSIFKRSARMEAKVDQILVLLKQLTQGEKQMSDKLQSIKDAVTKEETVIASAVTLLQGLSAQVAALKDSPTPEAIQALADQISADSQSLASAVTANTPAAPASTTTTGTSNPAPQG